MLSKFALVLSNVNTHSTALFSTDLMDSILLNSQKTETKHETHFDLF